jgi:hypothetical protein
MKCAGYIGSTGKIEGHRLRDTMERYHLEDVSIDRTILLKYVFKK